jgi:flagellar hook assembly protein FlgD
MFHSSKNKLVLSAILAASVTAGAADYTAWSGHRDIVLNTSSNGAGTTADVHNFPVLIRLGSAEAATILAQGGTNGASIRFSKADNATPLPYEIEQWTTTSAAIWVKVDTIKGNNATQKIRMHWGNGAAASESNGPAVFDTANGFVGAWHFGNAAGTSPRPGSVLNSPKAVLRNGLPAVSGIIGLADTLGTIAGADPANGSNPAAGRWIDMGKDSVGNNNNYAGFSDFTTGFAYSAWIQPTSTAAFTRFIVLGADSAATNEQGHSSRIMFMGNQNQSATQPNFSIRWAGVANYNSPANAYSYNTWTQIFVSKPAGTSAITVYKNGEVLSSSAEGDAPANVIRNYAWIGRSSAGTDGFYGGKVDNLTLAKRARSADWIKMSFQNQKAVNALVDIGAYAFTASAPGTPTNVTATATGNASATVSWTAPASNGGSAITGYKVVASDDTSRTCTTNGTVTSCTVNGLTVGQTYTFIVTASNAIGTGPGSFVSNEVIPMGIPSTPTSVTAKVAPGSGVIAVSWVASTDGGSPITAYKAYVATDSAKSCTTTNLTCNVTGLTLGTSYTFSVKATNAIGTSAASSPTAAIVAVPVHPGSFVISMSHFTKPYTYRIPESVATTTEALTLSISDSWGRTVWERTVNPSKSTTREISWNGVDSKGSKVSAGMYVVKVTSKTASGTQEVVRPGVKLH